MPQPLRVRPQGRSILAAVFLTAAFFAYGEEYLGRDEFLASAFAQQPYEVETLWFTEDSRNAARLAVGWVPKVLRMRYWQSGSRTAWILEHIGKEKPITLGVVVEDAKLVSVQVLAFRESRGWEIRYPFFTDQFTGLFLARDGYLSDSIDGITGATLSVRAVERMSRLALWLDAQVQSAGAQQ